MSRATLAVLLSKLDTFENPKARLEQHATPSEAAATILWDARTKGLIEGKRVLDLGAGTGILGIGALILGAAHVDFIEKDPSLKEAIERNISTMQEETDAITGTHDVIIADATATEPPRADLVVTNPPFGTKERHADTRFLEQAFTAAGECYSFHKSSTDAYLEEWFRRRGITVAQRFPFLFNLPNTMPQHEKQACKVPVTCWHARKDL
ncbi:RsmD family RNA methyltransferase [Candidatus Woesearchaeota archaeon]|nr:RsmD family RNA methyltransferase [Candidatus Woesearchaeota archaeon]